MTWQRMPRNESGEGEPFIRLGSTRRNTGALDGELVSGAYSQMFLQLSVSLAQYLGIRAGDRVKLERGRLGDVGWMRISKGNEQKATRMGHKGSIRVRFTGRWLGIRDSNKPVSVKYICDADGDVPAIKFQLPKWARKNEVGNGSRSEERE